MTKILIQTQLSNYDTNGKFILECDSGWQMMMGRIREMLRLVPDIQVYIMGPNLTQVRTLPYELNRDLFNQYFDQLHYIPHYIIPNALATRYDFNLEKIAKRLGLGSTTHQPFTHVFINDPMHLRNFRAMFFLFGKYAPHFTVHSHFIDNPECPKFPTEASLWFGQMEAALKADFNFWQCESSMNIFTESAHKWLRPELVTKIHEKSRPWDDGYSSTEFNSQINESNVRFDLDKVKAQLAGKWVIFVPNRIGGMGRSSDYTNCGKFMFEIVPEVWRKRGGDFVVIAGNPSQKILNSELEQLCPAFYNLVPDALNRDEYKVVARELQHVSVGLYNQDSYGGTAAREICDVGTIPLWVDNYEYAHIAKEVGWPRDRMIQPDLEDTDIILSDLLQWMTQIRINAPENVSQWHDKFQKIVRKRCSYEETTPEALHMMGML